MHCSECIFSIWRGEAIASALATLERNYSDHSDLELDIFDVAAAAFVNDRTALAFKLLRCRRFEEHIFSRSIASCTEVNTNGSAPPRFEP